MKTDYRFAIKLVCCLLAPSISQAWLGERLTTSDQKFSDESLGSEQNFFIPWIASDELKRQQKIYRDKIKNRWPEAQDSLQTKGFTYYPDDFNVSVSVVLSENKIEIILPRDQSINQYKSGTLQQSRARILGYLQNLLGMNRLTMLSILADEIMLESSEIQAMAGAEELIFAELFPNNNPTEDEVYQLAHRILKTARLGIKGQDPNQRVFGSDRLRFVMYMPDARLELAAKKYYKMVKHYSEIYKVPPSLLLAIIHTESHFNPLARSKIPAFGLMQIVPTTAGVDAAQLIYKEKQPTLSPAFLFNERNNLELGAAYLHILYYRYLAGIKSERSRAYTAIAAYNTGPSNIARAFVAVPRMSEAIPLINTLSDREVLMQMQVYAPAQETREYLTKVIAREKFYEQALKYW